MDALTIIFRTVAVASVGFCVYFAVKKRFWFPAFPLLVLAVASAGAAEGEWKQLLVKTISLLVLYVGWTIILIVFKKPKEKKEKNKT